MVGIPSPEERLAAYPHQFSGGMRQRVAIAIALLHRPDLIIADEPTTALDVTIQSQILAQIQRLVAGSRHGAVWISHDLGVVAGLAHRIAVMYAGRIVETGPTDDVLDRPVHPYTIGLLQSVPANVPRGAPLRADPRHGAVAAARGPTGCAFRPRCAFATAICETEPPLDRRRPRGLALFPSRSARRPHDAARRSRPASRSASCAISTMPSGSRGSLGADVKPQIVHAVDRGRSRGSCRARSSASSANPAAASRPSAGILAGIMPQSDGEVLWQGRDRREPRAARTPARRGSSAQMIFQDPMSSLNPRKRVHRHHRRGARRPRHRLAPGEGRLRGRPDGAGRARSRPIAARYPHQFSGGQRQRIGIARALAVKPRFIVCDEFVAALDVSIQAQIINLFMDLKRELGLTYLFISHDLGVVKHISDRVAIMYLGRIVESAPADEFFAQPEPSLYRGAARARCPRIAHPAPRLLADQGRDPLAALTRRAAAISIPAAPTPSSAAAREAPTLAEIAPGHISACHLNDVRPTAARPETPPQPDPEGERHENASTISRAWRRGIAGRPPRRCRRRLRRIIIIGSSTEPSALDPHFSRTGNNQNVAAQIFDRLFMPDPNLQVTPALAESWQNVDPTTWRIKLRSGVTFHDGSPLTAGGRDLLAQARQGHPEQPGALHRQCRRHRQR